MKWLFLPGIGITMLCLSGCATSLPPHAELHQAVTKSFTASGFNYSSKSRVTNLSLGTLNALPTTADKKLPNVGAALDIVRGFTVNIDGALDVQSKRTEALYNLRYNKDNVEISLRFPLLIDYRTQNIYLGPSIFNTVLNMVVPQEATTSDQLIKINIPELMREATANSPELAKLYDDSRFSAKNMDLITNVCKAAIVKAVAGLDDTKFSDQPLTEQDRQAGVTRRIQVKLGHDDTVAAIMDMIDTIAQNLFQEGAISKSEYAVLLMLTDKQKLEPLLQMIDLAIIQDVSVANTGYIRYLKSHMTIADKEGNVSVGLENVSAFDHYNAPQFSITPETSQIIDFKEVLQAIMTIAPQKSTGVPPTDAASDEIDLPTASSEQEANTTGN